MELKVRIYPDGTVKVEVIGVQGEQCLKLTEFLEKALGDVTEREFKSDYYETMTTILKQTQRLSEKA